MVKISKVIFRFLIIIIVLYFLVGHFTSINFDVGPCAGGYKRCLIDDNLSSFYELLDKEYKNYQVDFDSAFDDIHWSYHKVFIPISIIADNEKIDLVIVGRKYWVWKYNWYIEK